MTNVEIIPLEKIVRRAPLAVRLIDAAFNQPATSVLNVTAYRLDTTKAPAFQTLVNTPRQFAMRSPMSGIYGFAMLDGLIDYEWDRRPASDYCPAPDSAPNYAIAIQDMAGLFMPQTLALCLPNSVPQDNLLEVDLQSNVTRTLPDSFGVLRADLWDVTRNQPAAWALVQANLAPTLTYTTIADSRGVAMLPMPYPPPERSPQFGNQPLNKLTWPCAVQVHYAPALHKHLLQFDGAKLAGLPPTTRSILDQTTTPAVTLVLDRPSAGPPIEGNVITGDLAFRKDVVLRTQGLDASQKPFSSLLIKS